MATSRMALPVMTIYCLVLWLAMLATEPLLLPSCILFFVNTYLMVELNNRNTLMRQYSRMVSCSYIAVMMLCQWIIKDAVAMLMQTCFIMFLTLIFQTYQKRYSVGKKYWAYLFVGIISILWPRMLIFVPIFWVCESLILMSHSAKGFWASVFGILTPLWVIVPYYFLTSDFDSLLALLGNYQIPSDFINTIINPDTFVKYKFASDTIGIVQVMLLFTYLYIGVFHFFRNSHSEKIHVRMLYQFMVVCTVAFTIAYAFANIMPFDTELSELVLFSAIIVCASPFIAHYITFTSTKLTNISVIVGMIVVFSLTLYLHVSSLIQGIDNISFQAWTQLFQF